MRSNCCVSVVFPAPYANKFTYSGWNMMHNGGMNATNNTRQIFDLEQPRTQDMPMHPAHKPGYSYVLHKRHEDSFGTDGPRAGASGLIVCKEHAGTHIDALCHQSENMFLCGGVHVDAAIQSSNGFSQHGVETIAPLVAQVIVHVNQPGCVQRVNAFVD